METPIIRRAKPADVPALTEVIDAAYVPYRSVAGLPDVTAGLANHITDDLVWVAVAQKGVVGCVVLSCNGDMAHLVNLAVSPSAAGKGLGRQLVETALGAARQAGARHACLATHREMRSTRRFYARLGWREVEASGAKIILETKL